MRRLAAVLLAAALSILGKGGVQASPPLTIVTLGDSITKGWREGVGRDQAFAALLERGLTSPDRPVRVINAGVGGETTDRALARLEREVLAHGPRVVTLMYGTNDSYVDRGARSSRLTVEAYRDNLARLVEAIGRRGGIAVLMTPPRWARAGQRDGLGEIPNRRLEPYVAACRELARRREIPLVDHYARWTEAERDGTDLDGWTTDGCHPNPVGHRILAEAILPVLRPLLATSAAATLDYRIRVDTALTHDDGKFLWYHPRAAAMPGAGRDGGTPVLMTIQKHLHASDHYSGLSVMRSDDLGRRWTGPEPRPELDWKKASDRVTVAVADVTPGWHRPTRRLLALGAQVRYSPAGEQLDDIPRAHQTAYAVHDPEAGTWTPWTTLAMPEEPRFDFARNACSQWLVRPDGSLLVPLYHGTSSSLPYRVSVARCGFDGKVLKVLEVGNELTLDVARGLYEPSLAFTGQRYYLTMRNDLRGYVSASDDGLHFGPIRPWQFDDGSDLGSYNTQQHWLAHSDGLFLVYTRRGANNDHIERHRAPLFLARVDPASLRVVRSSERVLIPERGAELGNFGASAITADESWVTVAEGIWNDDARRRGAKGAVFVARVLWSAPNRLLAPAGP